MTRKVLPKNNAWAQRFLPLCLCGVVGVSLVAGSLPAMAQSSDLQARIKRMENEIDTLNRAVYKGETPPPISQESGGAAAATEARLSQMETDLRTLTGKVEQQSYDNQQLQQKLDALEQDARMRLDTLEAQARGAATQQPQQQPMQQPPLNPAQPPQGGLTGADTGAPPMPAPLQNDPSVEVNPPDLAGSGSAGGMDAAALYEQGFAEIKQENYPAAEKTFAKFIKDYPGHALAPNALYWLGETYYVRKDYDKASRVFAESYQKYPNGPKGADNLLKLAMSLSGKGEKPSACVALAQLKKEYPNGPAPVMTRGEQEAKALDCK